MEQILILFFFGMSIIAVYVMLGELKADRDTMKDADNFTWQAYSNANDPDASIIKEDKPAPARQLESIANGANSMGARARQRWQHKPRTLERPGKKNGYLDCVRQSVKSLQRNATLP